MKNYSLQKHLIRLCAALALAVSAIHAQAQNALVTFDLTQLQNNVASSTITGSDGSTTLTVSTTHDWGGNTGAINVDGTNGLLVTGVDSNRLSLSFSKSVTLERYFLSSINYDSFFIISLIDEDNVSNNTSVAYNGSQTVGSADFSVKLNLTQNHLRLVTNNPLSSNTQAHWSSLTVSVVPEPASYALLLGFGAFLFIMIRHRIRR